MPGPVPIIEVTGSEKMETSLFFLFVYANERQKIIGSVLAYCLLHEASCLNPH